MNSRALTLALRLLTTACAGVALGTMTGCPFIFGCGDDTGWQEQELIDVGVAVELLYVTELYDQVDDRAWSKLAVGVGGTIVAWGDDWSGTEAKRFAETSSFGNATLRGAVAVESGWWVVGDGGTMGVSQDRGASWTAIDSGTAASLYAIALHGAGLVAVGDGVVVVEGPDGVWAEVLAPSGDWGQLRALYSDGSRLYAVGLGGAVWSTDDASGTWVAETVGTSDDLLGVCYDYASGDRVLIVGAGGTLLVSTSGGGWSAIESGVSVDLIACSNGGVLGADGDVYSIDSDGKLSSIGNFGDARSLVYNPYAGALTVGAGGEVREQDYYECIGGRPFVVDGELHTAAPQLASGVGASWCGDAGCDDAPSLDPELAEPVAAAWVQDGLYEHASIASFARFALELLALGAPPQLIADAQRAAADELHHAQLCFELARRLGGVAFEPGPMPITPAAFARVGDPVATALALFHEGCVNESVAACEAADAAEAAEDPAVRRALEIIAADERRHATMAWAALRWLIDQHGERVLAPLREHVEQLGASRPVGGARFDDRLRAYGRVAPRRRAEIQRQVIDGLVRPLARALVGASPTDIII